MTTGPDQKPKTPPYMYLICALPLAMVLIGGAIGGALGGAGFGLALISYQKTRSPGIAFAVSVGAGIAAFLLWSLIVAAIR
jgi:hypothetical protein